ncbi:MAG: hypothetical protein HC850_09140 [Rhodomicrobium sp.]|nr:hypothetical protein [Rhodomicrobium sp.]
MLMIVKVLEIAGRAVADAPDGLEGRQRGRLEKLVGSGGDTATLVAQIREGLWDEPRAAERLHGALTQDAHDRLARLNPKYLDALTDGT